jgi:hypothetical protein
MLSFYPLSINKTNMNPLTNPLPIVFIIATAFGVLMHDTQVDRAAQLAIIAPSSFSDFAVADASSKATEHVHVERVSVLNASRSSNPNNQPRDDHRRYIQPKKTVTSSGSNGVLPPA